MTNFYKTFIVGFHVGFVLSKSMCSCSSSFIWVFMGSMDIKYFCVAVKSEGVFQSKQRGLWLGSAGTKWYLRDLILDYQMR